ncbi:MAG: HdeD family acid-resistance protein [Chloroflexi bacterium]|nr:MAG: HdeD family acid-resistance protein [Chloroflexota bacterium]
MLAIAARQWWVLLLQGVLGIIVGILAIIYPDLALATVALLFAAWAVVSGVSQLAAGWRVAEARGRSWPFLLAGAVSVIAGVLAVLYTGITILYLILLLGAWILISGAMEVYTAWKIRDEVTGEWILALAGILRIVVGLIILAMPIIGAILTAALFATWAILSGVAALFLGFRLRQFSGRASAPGMA